MNWLRDEQILKKSHFGKIVFFTFLMIFFQTVICSPSFASMDSITANLLLRCTFDETETQVTSGGIIASRTGGTILGDGIRGSYVSLSPNEFIKLDMRRPLNSAEGTIMFWIRPHFDYYECRDGLMISHTFVSARWMDGSLGYLVVSDGWSEYEGSPFTYFVWSNESYMAVRQKILFRKGEWVHIACTWKSGDFGEAKLYGDGRLIASRQFQQRIKKDGTTEVYLGSDLGTNVMRERWGDCDFDELYIYDRALSEAEISQVLLSYEPDLIGKKMKWLESALQSEYRPYRDKDGQLLETRAIFDEGRGWMSEEGARGTIANIKKAGFNVYIPCVWHGVGARYPTQVVPSEENLRFGGRDPLKSLIDIAHQEGIEVHAWVCVALRQRDFLTDLYDEYLTPPKAFDLHRPAFQSFMTSLIEDLVRRYDVDGINLDYIRTMGVCTCSYCVSEYGASFNRSLLTDSRKLGGTEGKKTLSTWQDGTVEELVRRIYEKVKEIRRSVVLSVDGRPGPLCCTPHNEEGRQEVEWLKKGIVDAVFGMDYEPRPDIDKYGIMEKEINQADKLIPLLGNFDRGQLGDIYSRDAQYFANLVRYAQIRWPKGIAVYLYAMLNDSQAAFLAQGPFALGAKPRWNKEGPLPSQPSLIIKK